MIFDDPFQATANQAMRALTQAATTLPDRDGLFISCTTGDGANSWPLQTAFKIAYAAAEVGWDADLEAADGHGLVCVLDRGAMYRFATADPRDEQQPAQPQPAGRHLHLVREAS